MVLMIITVLSILLIFLAIHYVREASHSLITTFSAMASTTSTTATLLINPSILSIESDILADEGMRDFGEIAVIDIEKPDMLRFKLINWSVEGLRSLSLSGRAHLISESTSYRIDMPCILYFNVSCARITLLIPGYDAPLKIEPGRYSVRLEIYWSNAEGSGKARLFIAMRAYKASIIDLGYGIPEDTASWVMAEGSTRSYALLVDRVEAAAGDSGYGEFTAHVWVFAPVEEEKTKIFKFEISLLRLGKWSITWKYPLRRGMLLTA